MMATAAAQRLLLCICIAAATSLCASEDLYIPAVPITVDTWTNASAPWFTYPEVTPSSTYYIQAVASRPSLGISISGGGFRAATLALGFIRALHQLGVLHQARYLSSNSGGSWFNAAFSYQDAMPLKEFLGPYIPPAELTLATLQSVANGNHGSFAATIAAATIKGKAAQIGLKNAGESDISKVGGWTTAIGEAFLAPYNLADVNSTFSAQGTKGPIHAAQAALGLKTYNYQGDVDKHSADNKPRPFPIIVGSVRSSVTNHATFFPVEFTPEYVGVPAAGVTADPKTQETVELIGGGLVEPLGFNSDPPAQLPTISPGLKGIPDILTSPGQELTSKNDSLASNNGSVPTAAQPIASGRRLTNTMGGTELPALPLHDPGQTMAVIALGKTSRRFLQATSAAVTANTSSTASPVKPAAAAGAVVDKNILLPLKVTVRSDGVVPLKAVAGISSGAAAQLVSMVSSAVGATALKSFVGTERFSLWNQVNFGGNKWDFVDGAGTDNYAITPLLRRKVSVIVACVSSLIPITPKMTPEKLAEDIFDLSAYFGATPDVPLSYSVTGFNAAMFNKMKVFPTDGWARLATAVISSTTNGGPTHHLDEYEVQENKIYAIHGGWKVKVLWLLNAAQSAWETQLPEDVQILLQASRGTLKETLTSPLDTAKSFIKRIKAGISSDDIKNAGLEDVNFPYISTSNADYTPELTGLLSQLATWQMMQLKPQLDQLLQGLAAAEPAVEAG